MSKSPSLEDITNLCIRRGFFFQSSRIYGSLSGFFDYGPLGTEMRIEVLNSWWDFFVRSRDDIVGIYGSIITHPKVWVASGHVESFIDFIVRCNRCGKEYRADHLLEEKGIMVTELTQESLIKLLKENNVRCPSCGGELSEPEPFNLMFYVSVGPKGKSSIPTYLRPETAQLMFVNFKDIYVSMRLKLPFGIAQVGKAFRNEISPRNFLFRIREFEQMEIEYFVNPKKMDECPYFSEVKDVKVQVLSAEMQEKGRKEGREMTIGEAYEDGIITTKWHAYWIALSLKWLMDIGLSPERLRIREHVKTELAHYAIQTFDVEYLFPYMGWKEIEGISNRSDYDLKRHQEYSGKDLSILDGEEKVIPYVIEPSFGLERIILALITDSYNIISNRLVLSLHPKVAPVKVGVYPLVNKEEFVKKAREVYRMVRQRYLSIYDESGSIGRRYARSDEIGVPLGITIDGQTLEDNTVTLRFRDTRAQIRVKIDNIIDKIEEILSKWDEYEKLVRVEASSQ
ncbi:MAG TPA: glycine--tRNA ligase [Thermofilum sp.]|nr:glycine--tRNA ligase [Thermofilum sp.]